MEIPVDRVVVASGGRYLSIAHDLIETVQMVFAKVSIFQARYQ